MWEWGEICSVYQREGPTVTQAPSSSLQSAGTHFLKLRGKALLLRSVSSFTSVSGYTAERPALHDSPNTLPPQALNFSHHKHTALGMEGGRTWLDAIMESAGQDLQAGLPQCRASPGCTVLVKCQEDHPWWGAFPSWSHPERAEGRVPRPWDPGCTQVVRAGLSWTQPQFLPPCLPRWPQFSTQPFLQDQRSSWNSNTLTPSP